MTNATGPELPYSSYRARPRVIWALTTAMITFTILHGYLAALVVTDLIKDRSHGRGVFASSWPAFAVLVLVAIAYAAVAIRFFQCRPGSRTTALGLVLLNLVGGGVTAVGFGYAVVVVALLPQAAAATALLSAEVRAWSS